MPGRFRHSWLLFPLPFLLSCGGPADPADPCGPYPPHASSPYILPFQPGRSFVLGQGNCSDGSHRAGSPVAYAYDFLMPVGTALVAARSGTVVALEEQYLDGDHTPGHENFVDIRHADGTEAQYVHLTRNGVLVDVGDTVPQGAVIGFSGNTGDSSEPHLHFHLLSDSAPTTIPVTFRNAQPPADRLVAGRTYTAGPVP
ncbi:MAG: M23 family metallopeptidase [Gemmatimonadales bacterium]